MNRDALRALLIKHEALRLKPYKDTAGKLTIGVGRNLDDVGLSEAEAMTLLDNDLARVVAECRTAFPWFNSLCDVRQNVLCDMAFMGIERLKGFVKMLAAIERGDFDAAANEILCSKYAAEVGSRAVELAQMMKEGDVIH